MAGPSDLGRARRAGITLVETMVSLFILSLIASTSMGMIEYAMRNNEVLQDSSEELKRFSIARSLMKQDFVQLAARTPRSVVVSPAVGIFKSGDPDRGEALVSFTRLGWTNPGGVEQRGSAQFVEYLYQDGDLVRRASARIDSAQETPMVERVLMSDITDLTVRFRSGEGWADEWTAGASYDPVRIPHAVEFTWTSARFGQMTQLFLTPQGG